MVTLGQVQLEHAKTKKGEKNEGRIDTEVTIGLFKKNGYEVVTDEEKAEMIVINTCRIY